MSIFSLNTTSLSEFDISNIQPDENYNNEFGMFQIQLDAVREDAEIFRMVIGRDFAEASTMVNDENGVITESQLIALTEGTVKKLKDKIIEVLNKFASAFMSAADSLLKTLETKVDYWGKVAKTYGSKAIENSKDGKGQIKYIILDKMIQPSCSSVINKYADVVQYYSKDAEDLVKMKEDITPETIMDDIIGVKLDEVTPATLYGHMFVTKEQGVSVAATKMLVQDVSSAKSEIAKFRKFKTEVLKMIKGIEKNANQIKDDATHNIRAAVDNNEKTKSINVSAAAASDLVLHNISCIRQAVAKLYRTWSSAFVKGMNGMASVIVRLAKASGAEEGKPTPAIAANESSKFFNETVCKEDEFTTSSSTADEKVAEPKAPPMQGNEPEEDVVESSAENKEDEEDLQEMSIEDLMKMVRNINESLELEDEEE